MLQWFAFYLIDCRETAYFSKSAVTSSSEQSPEYSAAHASLSSLSAWCPQQNFTDEEYLQVSVSVRFPTVIMIYFTSLC